ncbi:MAG: diaminopimelate decarboxylase [Gammaproteobacteria bacterium]|nr:diaminopimelate decarboxylase [Gammaproteobacteria bacterium]MBL6898513.1 diaminopimelate decarboxylase [Gammaproteobacteria bacterium]
MDIDEISSNLETPYYLYSENLIKENINSYMKHATKHTLFCYSVKANSNLSILKLIASMGMGFDVVSKGELYRVMKAGADSKKIVYSGVGKRKDEIKFALECGILCFNVESEGELHAINEQASLMECVANVSIRVNPDVAVETHPYISTGLKENKFGIPYKDALEIYLKASQLKSLNITGVDFHIGSQITTIEPYLDSLKSIKSLIAELEKKGISISHIDVGGGLGIKYQDENIINKDFFISTIVSELKDLNIMILFEPGRSIVGDCGILVSRVQYVKESDEKSFLILDASMSELIRPPLYNAHHNITAVHRTDAVKKNYDVVGPVCESADFLGKNRLMNVNVSDLVIIEDVGAYGFVLSSNYNTRPKPAEYIISNGNINEIRSADTLDQILANEL